MRKLGISLVFYQTEGGGSYFFRFSKFIWSLRSENQQSLRAHCGKTTSNCNGSWVINVFAKSLKIRIRNWRLHKFSVPNSLTDLREASKKGEWVGDNLFTVFQWCYCLLPVVYLEEKDQADLSIWERSSISSAGLRGGGLSQNADMMTLWIEVVGEFKNGVSELSEKSNICY